MRIKLLLATCMMMSAVDAGAQQAAPIAFTYRAPTVDTIAAVRSGITILTTKDVITELANRTRQEYQTLIALADERSKKLRSVINWQTATYKAGQYVGGGGAMLFGFTDNGRNAAYAGAVSAVFTLADNIFSSKEKIEERAACREITAQFSAVGGATDVWIAKAGEAAFQAQFPAVLADFHKVTSALVSNSRCDFVILSEKARLRAQAMAAPVRLP